MANISLQVWAVAAFAAAAIILVAVAAYVAKRRRITDELQLLFGPEYDRAVRLYGNRARAEAALTKRRVRLNEMGVHELTQSEKQRLLLDWKTIQSAAGQEPGNLLVRADQLIEEVMRLEGCLTDDLDERKLDFALIHPTVAEQYRGASDILARHLTVVAVPADYRRGILLYSEVFDTILGKPDLQTLRKVS